MPFRRWAGALACALVLAGPSIARVQAASPGVPTFVGGGRIHYENMVVVLTWHDVGDAKTADTIPTAAFDAQIRSLGRDHYHPISPTLFARFIEGKAPVPPNAVLLTFDNGCEGVWREAYPVLKGAGFPFLLFPIFGKIGTRASFLTRPQLVALAHSPLVTIGSHTAFEHGGVAIGPGKSVPSDVGRMWTRAGSESWAHYDRRIRTDARRSQADIIRLTGARQLFFSDPFGQYTKRLVRLLATQGFVDDFTTLGWAVVAGAPADRIPRINVGTRTSTAQTMLGAILTVARDTARFPAWHPPGTHVRIWRWRAE